MNLLIVILSREFQNRCIPRLSKNTTDPKPSNPNGGGLAGSSGGGWGAPGQRLTAAAQEDQKLRNLSVQVLIKQAAILVSTKNKSFPYMVLPLGKTGKSSRFRRQVEVVRRRRLLQSQPQQWLLDPDEQIEIYFSKTGIPNFFQVKKLLF